MVQVFWLVIWLTGGAQAVVIPTPYYSLDGCQMAAVSNPGSTGVCVPQPAQDVQDWRQASPLTPYPGTEQVRK